MLGRVWSVVEFFIPGLVMFVVAMALWFAYRLFTDIRTKRKTDDRPPPWRDTNVLAAAAQALAVGIILSVTMWLWSNFVGRTDSIGLNPFDFNFIDEPSGITIADSPLSGNAAIRKAIQRGLLNTLYVIIVGIPISVIFGTLIGIARLSTNWLLSKIATVYVEFFRNLPPLLVIFLTWSVMLTGLPLEQNSFTPGLGLIFNNKRIAFPSIAGQENFGAFRLVMLGGLLVAAAVWVWRTRLFNNTGTPHRRVIWSLGTLLGIGVIAYFVLGGPVAPSTTEIVDRIYVGGAKMQMPYVALAFGLILYTASHISEIVRGSIQSVAKGQTEAGNALALSGFQRYRFVVLPQAFRVAFPPLINQFLNYTKNSSLAIAIGFAEITTVINNLFGQSRPAPQLLFILMASYLTFSLVLSTLGNLFNRRLAIVGR